MSEPVPGDDVRWVAVPVCDLCFRYPAHRKHRIKGHFFPEAHAETAVRHAGSANLWHGGLL